LSGYFNTKIERKENISDELLSSICRQLVNNLIAMLNKEICHRDIKPANVLKIKDDYFLADFGESEALDERELRINEYGTQQIEDFIKGTPRYLAPVIREQFLDKKKMYFEFHHDLFKSDIYSMGLVFLESLLMKEGFTDTQRITKILTSP
jgi:serine/threonine protein kinase